MNVILYLHTAGLDKVLGVKLASRKPLSLLKLHGSGN